MKPSSKCSTQDAGDAGDPSSAAAKAKARSWNSTGSCPTGCRCCPTGSARPSPACMRERFGLNMTEWRVMAVLGRYPDLSANEVAGARRWTRSRSAARWPACSIAAGSQREIHGDDRRRSVLDFSQGLPHLRRSRAAGAGLRTPPARRRSKRRANAPQLDRLMLEPLDEGVKRAWNPHRTAHLPDV